MLLSQGGRKVTETILVPKRPLLCEREMLLSKLFLHIKGKIISSSLFVVCFSKQFASNSILNF